MKRHDVRLEPPKSAFVPRVVNIDADFSSAKEHGGGAFPGS
jgi:hypothetical protein